jgi:predicted Zn finger-like uncharacterized protein
MVIECPECATRFRLSEDKLRPRGTKVRCSKCATIFTVHPPADAVAEARDKAEDWSLGAPAGAASQREPEPGAPDESFDFDEPTRQDDTFGDEGADAGRAGLNDEFDFDERASAFAPTSFADEAPGDEAQPPFERGLAEEAGEAYAAFGWSAEAAQSEGDNEFSERQEAAYGASEEAAEAAAEEPFAPAPPTWRPPVAEPAVGASRRSLPLLPALLLILLAVGGFLWWRGGLDAIPLVSRLVSGARPKPVPAGQLALHDLEGFFIDSPQLGQLFVVQGRAVNGYDAARSAMAVRGLLYDASGVAVQQQTVFCGNALSAAQLRTLSWEQIVERMNNQFGDSLVNENVAPGKAVPFTIVFRELPQTMTHFAVEEAGARPSGK